MQTRQRWPRAQRTIASAVALAIGLVFLSAGGCMVKHGASSTGRVLRAEEVGAASVVWPTGARAGEQTGGSAAPTVPRAPGRHDIVLSAIGIQDGEWVTRLSVLRVDVAAAGRYGRGVLIDFWPRSRDRGPGEPDRFLRFTSHLTDAIELDQAEGRLPPRRLRRLVGRPVGGVTMSILEPRDAPPRGVAICLQAFGASKYTDPVMEGLRARGWLVVETDPPFGLWPSTTHDLGDEEKLLEVTRSLTDRLDERLAEWAFGCEAGLEYVASLHPDLVGRPVVLVGFSLGAMALPAAAACLEGRVDAAVLIGGGADIMRTLQTSDLPVGGAQVRWKGERPPRRIVDLMSEQHLAASRLDPYHLAPRLASIPVLQVHASWDKIVPSAAGDLLYERLGRPDRWTFPFGHQLLFWRLPAYAGEIADWLDAAVRETPGASGGADEADRAAGTGL